MERAVLTDFGLARAADDVSMTRWGIIAGTPEYMSPEQARGEALDGRSDLFSLGCVFYEMATGVSPFRTDSTMATLRRIVDEQPAAMASLVPELPPWFCHIVERLLSKDPHQRFASASEVSQLLEQCLSHLQQPTSGPLPAYLSTQVSGGRSPFNQAKGEMKSNPYAQAFFLVLHLFGDMLLGRGITAGWPIPVGPKPTGSLPLWALTALPVWFFCLVTPIQSMFDIMCLVSTATAKDQSEILAVLSCSFEAFLFGLMAAQFSVAVTPSRSLRPLMSLWILVLPYLTARQVGRLVADWFGHIFARVPIRLTNDIGSYLVIAILSAIIYSFVTRREPGQSPQTQPENDPPTLVPHADDKGSIFNITLRGVIAMLGTIGIVMQGALLLQQVPEPPDNPRVDKFAELDTDQDSRLSLAEFGLGRTPKYSLKWFELRDVDHDGFLSLAEFAPESASAVSGKPPEVKRSDKGLPVVESLDQ